MLILEDNSLLDEKQLVLNANSYLSSVDFDAWLIENALSIEHQSSEASLKTAFIFMSGLDWTESHNSFYVVHDAFKLAQCFIAYAAGSSSSPINLFDPFDPMMLTSKGLGRGGIVKSWAVNSDLISTEPMTLLRRMPLAYSLLNPFLSSTINMMRH